MADQNPTNNMHFLSVNPEDYLYSGRRRVSVASAFSTTSALDVRSIPVSKLRGSSSNKELCTLDQASSIDTTNVGIIQIQTSSASPCFGKSKKKLHRHTRLHDDSVYRPRCNTDPGPKQANILTLPPRSGEAASSLTPTPVGRRRREGSSALSSLIEQTLKVTTASVGLRRDSRDGLAKCHTTLNNDEKGVNYKISRSTSSVINLAHTPADSSMAPLQGSTEAQSCTCLNTIDKKSTSPQQQQQQQQNKQQAQRQQYCQQHSLTGSEATNGSAEYSLANSLVAESNRECLGNLKSDSKSLKHSSISFNPLVGAVSLGSVRSISPSRKSVHSSSGTTAKNEPSLSTAAAATAAATPPEKEKKKRNEVSSSRVKKLHRHFTQVAKDEKLLNYYSCALVSDILLQGHLYITDQHFAFYSNVFGYVTKVVIPTSSVTKISKEKTAKIIPNAVGVATADERHVFSSFISREAAFRLMCSVCPPLAPIELLPKIPADIEYSEELSIEDDSSCSISGNESPPQALDANAASAENNSGQVLLRRTIVGSSLNEKRTADIPNNAKTSNTSQATHQVVGVRASAPPSAHYSNNNNNIINNNNNCDPNNSMSSIPNLVLPSISMLSSASVSSSPTSSSQSSTTSSPTTVMSTPKTAAQAAAASFKTLSKNALLRMKFPTEFHVVYLGVLLSIVLALFSGFLLYRILDIEAKTSLYRSPAALNWDSVNDDDIFADALRWQKELQTKSTEEAQSILNTNLEQIAKVRRSLETLSMLIHDRSAAASDTSFGAATNTAEALNRDDSD